MDAKVNNLNTTFLRGIVTSQKLTKPFSQTQTLTLSTKDHFMLMTQGHYSIKISNKTYVIKVYYYFYELNI